MGLGDLGQGKFCGKVRAGASLSHPAPLGPVAQHQAEGIEHDRLARARFPGNGGEAAAEADGKGLNDGKVLDFKVAEHAWAPGAVASTAPNSVRRRPEASKVGHQPLRFSAEFGKPELMFSDAP